MTLIPISCNDATKITHNVSGFYCQGDSPQQLYQLSIGGQLIASTDVFRYDSKLDMWEIVFFTKIVNLFDCPDEVKSCLLFDNLNYMTITINCKQNVKLFAKLPDTPFKNDSGKYTTYVEFAQKIGTHKNNCLLCCSGMIGYKFANNDGCNCNVSTCGNDFFNGKHSSLDDILPLYNKYVVEMSSKK